MHNKSGWRRLPVVELCETHVDCVNRTAPVVGHETPYKMLRTTNIKNGYINTIDVKYVDEPTYKKWTRRLVPRRGDVILTREAPLGEVGKIRTDEKVFLGQRLYHFRPAPERLDADFLLYALMAPDLQGQIKALGSGSTVEHMRLGDIPTLEIDVPSVQEQGRIAGILSAYDDLIENCQRRIRVLEDMARGLYREWFVHFRFPGAEALPRVDSPIGLVPQGCEVRGIKDVAEVIYGFPYKSKAFNSLGEGMPIVRIRDIPVGASSTYTAELADVRYAIKDGDILVGMDGDFHMCIWAAGPAVQNQRVAKFRPLGEIGTYHLFLALEAPIQRFNKEIVGTTVAHLGDMHIKNIKLVWPPADIRQKLNKTLEPAWQQVVLLRKKVANLRRTRDLLLPRLMSGQIRLEAAEEALDAASAL